MKNMENEKIRMRNKNEKMKGWKNEKDEKATLKVALGGLYQPMSSCSLLRNSLRKPPRTTSSTVK